MLKPRRNFVDRFDNALDYWLGYAAPPADHAVQCSTFLPDAPDAYCRNCGDSVGFGEYTSTGCASCRSKPALADTVVRLSPYVGDLREWILRLKYAGWSPIGVELGRMLARSIQESGAVDLDNTIIVPMPMPWQRRLYRGIDHTQVIAVAIARELDIPLVRILSKKHGPPQVALSATDRQRHGGRNLRVRRRLGGWNLKDIQLVLVDDVRTTGTTIRRAVRLLQQLDPKTIVVSVAAVADPVSRRARQAARGSESPTD